ncbi:MAG: hypothetical protein SGCHY_001347 [Lobulomycetales sp.]
MECPICHQSFRSLPQLNAHIDTDHEANVAEQLADNVVFWFNRTRSKLKDVLQEVDVADGSDDELARLRFSEAQISSDHFLLPPPSGSGAFAKCVACDKRIVGRPCNCRKCGRLFCSEHCNANYLMKLSQFAIPMELSDPSTGEDFYWARVCMLCYTSRDSYTDTNGTSRRRTAFFLHSRRVKMDKLNLETNVIEKRLKKVPSSLPLT